MNANHAPRSRLSSISALLLAALVVFSVPQSSPAAAQEADFGQLVAEAVPVDVNEIVTGGSWAANDKEGVYRAISVLVPKGEVYITEVYLQWVAFPTDGSEPEIVSTVAIKEVSTAALSDATISLDAENADEVVVTVSAYDQATDKDQIFGVKATAPGKYETVDVAAQ